MKPSPTVQNNKKIIEKHNSAEKILAKADEISSELILTKKTTGKIISKKQLSDDNKEAIYRSRIKLAQESASILYKHGARRVWLFGSLAIKNIKKITEHTDIDIAVEGMNKAKFEKVRKEIQKTTTIKIDIVYMATTNPGFRHDIVKKRIFLAK